MERGRVRLNWSAVASLAFAVSLIASNADATPCNPEPTDMSVVFGNQITCDTTAGDTDLYRFSAAAGNRVLAEAVEISGGPGYTPYISLFAPDGTLLGQTYGPARLDRVVSQTGTYTAVVSALTSSTVGEYAFTVSCIGGSCTPTPPPPPAPPPGALILCPSEPVDLFPGFGTRVACDTTAGDADLYRFSGAAGDRILAEAVYLSGSSYTPYIELYAPDGTLLGQTYGPAREQVVLPQSGVYTAVVHALSYATSGQYAFTVACTGGSCLPPPGELPSLMITLTGCTTACAAGIPFTVQGHFTNPASHAITAELKMGLRFPDGTQANILGNKHLEIPVPAGLNVTTNLLSFLWPAALPVGTWTFEVTLSGPDLGDTFSRQVKTFTVVP